MNIPSLSLSLLAAAALLVSCTQDELSGGVALPAGNALHVSSAVIATGSGTEMEIATRTKSGTRADASNTLVPVTSGSLGIFRSKGTNYTSALDNKKYTYTGDTKGWQPATSSDTIYLNGDDAEVCAYYPYNSNSAYADKTKIPVVSGKFYGNDLCYATNRTLNGSQRATTFELKHAMAMLEFKISKEADYKGDCRITSVSIQNPELLSESQLNITNGTYTTASGTTKGKLTYNPGTDNTGILIESTPATTAALLAPFKPTATGLAITFVANGVNVETNIPATKIANVEAGKRYTVSIIMKAASMQVTGVDMVPWDEIGVGGDDFTWYPTEENRVLDIGLDFLIAPGNVVATRQDDGSYTYTFAKEQGYYSEGVDYANVCDYFCWNTLNPSDITTELGEWNNARDVCRQIDDGNWYTPTFAQWESLRKKEQVWGTYTMKNGEKKYGRYYGTYTLASAEANQDNYVFLPATGQRINQKVEWEKAGSHGHYWCSEVYPAVANRVRYVLISEAQTYTSSFCTGSFGKSVRCVRDK